MRMIWAVASALIPAACAFSAGPSLVLYDSGRVTSRIITSVHPSALESLAAREINRTALALWGFELPVFDAGGSPELHNSIVIGTPGGNPIVRRLATSARPDFEWLGDEGFRIQRVDERGGSYLSLAANTPAGILNAARYAAAFSLQNQGGKVVASSESVKRRPAFAMRGTYNLACWGLAPRYTRQDWERIIDAMAEDGMNVIYFWISGLFRSQTYPETFVYPETPLTTDDFRQLIRHAHSRGVDFYLGSGVFAWFGVDEIARHHAEVREVGIPHMCRTLPAAHQAMQRYLMELYDTFPEARGMWLEIGCEGNYHCQGPLCQRAIDQFGSKQIGLSELSFLRTFATELWKKHPQAKLVWGMGYRGHKSDVKYYDAIRRDFRDPRYYFLEVRQNWAMPDAGGVLKPLVELSPNIMHWDQYYALPLRDLGERARRIQQDGLAGWIVAFEPGFNSFSVYGRRVPYPVDLIPYRLTRFAYREFTFNPTLSWAGFRKQLLAHFFGSEANPELADLTLALFEFIHAGPIHGSYTELTSPVDGSGYARILRPRLAAIEKRLDTLEPGLPARGHQVGLPLLQRTIQDLRKAYTEALE